MPMGQFVDRPPLKWETVHLATVGGAVVEVQKAVGFDGRVRYTWRLSRQSRDKTVAFLFPDQAADSKAAIDAAMVWIAEVLNPSAAKPAEATNGSGKGE